MKPLHKRTAVRLGLGLVLLLLGTGVFLSNRTTAQSGSGNSNPPPYDFSDSFYLENGVNPFSLRERACNSDRDPTHAVFDPPAPSPDRNTCRILQTTGGFDASGNLIYYSVMAPVFPEDFTNDDAGRRAREIANAFRAFLFPRDPDHDGVVVLSPALANRRQDNVFDTRNGYFSNNPLGLWILAFVVYTPKAFTPEGQKILAPIAATNGLDLDGTPILTSASLIDNLAQKGIVEIRTRPLDGSQGFPWVL